MRPPFYDTNTKLTVSEFRIKILGEGLMSTVLSIIARPGTGKTTQMEFLENLGFHPLVMSRLLVLAGYNIAPGKLLSDEVANSVILRDFHPLLSRRERLILLDGFPRTVGQLMFGERLVRSYNGDKILYLYLNISQEEALERLRERVRRTPPEQLRPDDNEKVFIERFSEFDKKTSAVIETLRRDKGELGSFIEINASAGKMQVFEEIVRSLADHVCV